MSRLTALPCDLAEPVPAVAVTTAISQGISLVPALILLVLALCQELVVELLSVGAALVGFNRAVALLVELVPQRATSALGRIISHATARLKQ